MSPREKQPVDVQLTRANEYTYAVRRAGVLLGTVSRYTPPNNSHFHIWEAKNLAGEKSGGCPTRVDAVKWLCR